MAVSMLRSPSQHMAAVAAVWALLALLVPTGSIGTAQAAQVRVGGGHVAVAPRGATVVRSGTVVRGGTVVTGPRGNAAAVRTTVVAPGGWARPGYYHWPRGGAIAAGAAIGFVVAASAAAYAGQPPAPGMCWYYADASRYRGFWDYCPY